MAFQREYNDERPHAALGAVPTDRYVASPRVLPAQLPPIIYPAHYEVRRVVSNGCVKWRGDWVSVSVVLTHEDVGFEEMDDGVWAVYFGPMRLGTFDERRGRIQNVHHTASVAGNC